MAPSRCLMQGSSAFCNQHYIDSTLLAPSHTWDNFGSRWRVLSLSLILPSKVHCLVPSQTDETPGRTGMNSTGQKLNIGDNYQHAKNISTPLFSGWAALAKAANLSHHAFGVDFGNHPLFASYCCWSLTSHYSRTTKTPHSHDKVTTAPLPETTWWHPVPWQHKSSDM